MTLVKIHKIDIKTKQENGEIAVLGEGEHVFGRGSFLQCADNRVSRKHGSINVSTDGKAFITSLHVNPCFHIADTNKGVVILPKNTPVELKDGDMFALLPNQYWFKARICNETHNGNGLIASEIDNITPDQIDFQPSTSSGQKRKCDDFDSEQNKSARCSINTSPHNIKKEPDLDVTAQLSASVADGDITSQISSLKVEVEPPGESSGNPAWETANTHRLLVESNNVKKETVSDDEDQNQDEIPNEEEEQGTVKQEDTSNQPGEKNDSEKPKKTFRDRCWYGASCYRQNPDHKLKLSHPGDQDYDTDPEDNRPSCSYGAVCYRRNSDHRREFRHPKNAVPPSQRKRQKKRDTKPKDPATQDDDSEDDYDLDDPFINDGSEDEFQPSSSSETDCEMDSQETEGDSEDVKRLLKEAKRFTRNSKKD